MTSTAAKLPAPSGSTWTVLTTKSTLNTEHAGELHTALRTYIDHARKVGGTSRRAPRGRVPADIVAKYQAATGQ
jgi:hypothetical protein